MNGCSMFDKFDDGKMKENALTAYIAKVALKPILCKKKQSFGLIHLCLPRFVHRPQVVQNIFFAMKNGIH